MRKSILAAIYAVFLPLLWLGLPTQYSEESYPVIIGLLLWVYTLGLLLGSVFEMGRNRRLQTEVITSGQHFSTRVVEQKNLPSSIGDRNSTRVGFTNLSGTELVVGGVGGPGQVYGLPAKNIFFIDSILGASRQVWIVRLIVLLGAALSFIAVSIYAFYRWRYESALGQYPTWSHPWVLIVITWAGIATVTELYNGITVRSARANNRWYNPVYLRGKPVEARVVDHEIRARWFNRIWVRYLRLTVQLPATAWRPDLSGSTVKTSLTQGVTADTSGRDIDGPHGTSGEQIECSGTFLVPKSQVKQLVKSHPLRCDQTLPLLFDSTTQHWAPGENTPDGYLVQALPIVRSPKPPKLRLRWFLSSWVLLYGISMVVLGFEHNWVPNGYRLQPWLHNSALLFFVGTTAVLLIGLVWVVFRLMVLIAAQRHWLSKLAAAIPVIGGAAVMFVGFLFLFFGLVFGAFDGKRFEYEGSTYLAEPGFLDSSEYICYRYEGLFLVKKLGSEYWACFNGLDLGSRTPPVEQESDSIPEQVGEGVEGNQPGTVTPAPGDMDDDEVYCQQLPDECFTSVWNGREVRLSKAQELVDANQEQVEVVADSPYGWVIIDAAAGSRLVYVVEKQAEGWLFLSEMPSVRGVGQAEFRDGELYFTNMHGDFVLDPATRTWTVPEN